MTALFTRLKTKAKEVKKAWIEDEPSDSDDEDRLEPEEALLAKSAPNITLNLHGGDNQKEMFVAAVFGIFLQCGILVFSGLTVYHPEFSKHFEKNGAPVKAYAYPLMATGTVVLVIGMMICCAVVEQSTEEMEIVSGPKYKGVYSDNTKLEARLLWLQRGHVVSDQSFDSFIIFAKTPRTHILTSRRNRM
jgi:hypothetical protein